MFDTNGRSPISPVAADVALGATIPTPSGGPSGSDQLMLDILVVEDSERLGRSLRAGLEAAGHRVTVEGDGRNGLQRAESSSFDLVLLDLRLPGLPGLDVLRRLRDGGHDVPVLILSAQDRPRDRVAGLRGGADDYLTKPFVFDELLARVEALGRRHRRQLRLGRLDDPKELVGRVLDGRYRIEREIGRGGFGTVFRARHVTLELPLAIKVLHRELDPASQSSRRFVREGVTACRVDHPNAVRVLDSGTVDGLPYLAMELLRGRTLAREIELFGLCSLHRAAEIVRPVCEVLTAAHAAGIVHRDVKPDNIFLDQRIGCETIKVLDFGLAKWLWSSDDSDVTMLETGQQLLGTLPFLAPERLRGERCHGASDVYSLGVVLFWMLAGRLPYDATDSPYQVLRSICFAEPPPVSAARPDLGDDVDRLVTAALAKSPEDRPTPGALADTLDELAAIGPARRAG